MVTVMPNRTHDISFGSGVTVSVDRDVDAGEDMSEDDILRLIFVCGLQHIISLF